MIALLGPFVRVGQYKILAYEPFPGYILTSVHYFDDILYQDHIRNLNLLNGM